MIFSRPLTRLLALDAESDVIFGALDVILLKIGFLLWYYVVIVRLSNISRKEVKDDGEKEYRTVH